MFVSLKSFNVATFIVTLVTKGVFFYSTVNCFIISDLNRPSSVKNTFGARITGLQIRDILNSSTILHQIHDLLVERRILVIEDQHDMSALELRRFSQYFGSLQIHKDVNSRHPSYNDVNVISNIKDPITKQYIGLHGADVEKFHTDLSW